MKRQYTLKDGTVLSCWYSDLGRIEIMAINGKDIKPTIEFELQKPGEKYPYDKANWSFEYNGETVMVENFDYIEYSELLRRVNSNLDDRWRVYSDEALPTLMKQTEKVGIIMDVDMFDTVIPGLGIGLKGHRGKSYPVLMVPIIDRYTKDQWGYKMEFRAEDPKIAPLVGTERYYYDDLWSLIMSNHFKLVDREEWRKQHPTDGLEDKKIGCSVVYF